MSESAAYIRAQETARRLITSYLDPGLSIHDEITDLIATETREDLGVLIGVLAVSVGDTYEDQADWSRHLVAAMAEHCQTCSLGHLLSADGTHWFTAEADAHPGGDQ